MNVISLHLYCSLHDYVSAKHLIIIAPNSLAHQRKGVQGEGEEEAGDQRNGGQTGTATLGVDAPTDLSRSGVLDVRNRRKHD